MQKLFVATAVTLALMSLGCGRAGNANNSNAPAQANANQARKDTREELGDSLITLKTKLALLAEKPTSGLEIDVDTNDGVVTLSGKVDTDEVKIAAGEAAKKIAGVKSVNNQLQVVAEARRKEVDATDDKIKDALAKAIDNDPKLSDMSLSIDVNAGVVTIDGTVDNHEQLLYAAQVIRKVPGVKSVVTSAVTVRE